MKKLISAITAAALMFSFLPTFAFADAKAANSETVTVSGYVSSSEGDILIASQEKTPNIYIDSENDWAGVTRAVGDLQSDIKAVTDVTANIVNDAAEADIIIGTIGKSAAVDALIANGSLDVSKIEGQWEAFTLQNVNGALVIAGADKRGTIYGIYDLSEKMGVSPWEWWADVAPQHSDAVYVSLPEGGCTEGAPSVKYRGIFINQEYNLWNWAKSLDGDIGISTETYKKVFELLLRLKANYMWPAMHDYTEAFNVNPENARLADEYGIVMASSHCEMLLRNNMGELLDFQEKWIEEHPDKTLYMFYDGSVKANVAYDYTDVDADGNPVDNKEFVEDYWRERVRANKAYESDFTIGMRGVHDGAWNPVSAKTTETKIALLEEIIAKQRQILSEEIGKPIEEIPQTFIPYKEIADLYNAGLSVPDDVTIMFTNDNYGHIRQCMTAEERERSGGGGMYYHVSYYGRPSSVIWNGGSQLGLIKEEMTKAYDGGANTVWVLNVGPLKGFENQTEYFLDLGRNIDTMRETKVSDYVADNARRYFGFTDEQAREYADIQCEFLEAANARRPDFQQQGLYSLTAYGDEGQKELDKYADLLARSEALYNSLPTDLQPAFYELQLYALNSAYNVTSNYVNADKSVLYKSLRRGGSVNKYAENSKSAWAKITDDMNEYNTMLGGKWNNIVNPFQKEESGSWDIMRNWTKDGSTAVSETVDTLPYTDMGIAVENQMDMGEAPALEFSGYTKDIRFIDIFNTGTGSLDWKVTSDADWIVFNKDSGTVYDDDRIYAGIDWNSVPTGVSDATITVTRYIGDNAVKSEEIAVKVNNDVKALPEKTYAEANGYVSIEVEHYSRSVASGNYEWQEQDDFGRSGNSVKFTPNNAESLSDNSAYLEYDVNFESAGTFNVDVYRMPTLNERGSVSFAVGIDDASPTILKGQNVYVNNSNGTDKWGKGILNNVEVLTSTVTVSEAGIHKIKLYGIDAGAVVDKIVVTTGTKYNSYYGAPESYNSTYNNGGGETVTAGVAVGDEPKLITDEDGGVGIIAVYKNDGTLVSVQTSENYSDGAFALEKAINPENGETVKGMVWSSLAEMKPLTGVYGKSLTVGGSETVMPEPSEPSEEIVGDITALFEPKLFTAGINADEGAVTSVDIIKLADVTNALVTAAAYDADGVMTGEKTVTADFTAVQINEKVSIPVDFTLPAGSDEVQIIVYDSREALNALSQSYTVSADSISLMASYDSGYVYPAANMKNYLGRETICVITDKDAAVKYIRQNTAAENTYEKIPFNGEGKFDLKIKAAGEADMIEESFSTIKNIETDTEPTSTDLYSWSFDTDQTGTGSNVPVLGGNAVYDETNKCVKLTPTAASGGSLTVDLSEAVTAAHGEKITIVSKIAYGNLSGKYMTYELTDSDGNMLVRSKINRYNNKTQTLTIVGVEQLTDGNYPSALPKLADKATSPTGKYSIYTAVIDPAANEIKLTISNDENSTVNEYSGKLPEGASYDLKKLYFTTDYNNASRTCYVDDISITKSKDAAYTITFAPTDGAEAVASAVISVTDAVTGAVIKPDENGAYKLCDGLYSYTVTADGYETVTDTLELSQATESKTILVEMNKSGSNPSPTPASEPTVTPTASPSSTATPTVMPTVTPTAMPTATTTPTSVITATYKFDFGASGTAAAAGYTAVTPDMVYDMTNADAAEGTYFGFLGTSDNSYANDVLTGMDSRAIDGFTLVKGQKIQLTSGGTNSTTDADSDYIAVPLKANYLPAAASEYEGRFPIRFSMKAENSAYYTVTATLTNSSATEDACVSLFSEKRQIIAEDVTIHPGEKITFKFSVDIESVYYKIYSTTFEDDMLNISVSGKNAAISSLIVEKHGKVDGKIKGETAANGVNDGTTMWLCTDSTGCDYGAAVPFFALQSYGGSGQVFAKYMPENIAVSNQGERGLATSDNMHFGKCNLKEGDYLYVQYGHNETSSETSTAAEIYYGNLQKYYDRAHSSGAKLIIASPVNRHTTYDAENGWTSGFTAYIEKAEQFVKEKIDAGADDIAFVDMNNLYVSWMNEESARIQNINSNLTAQDAMDFYYVSVKGGSVDGTHMNDAGADRAAYCFFMAAKEIVAAADGGSTDNYVKAQAEVVRPLVEGMKTKVGDSDIDNIPMTVSDDIINAGKAPNSYWDTVPSDAIEYDNSAAVDSVGAVTNGDGTVTISSVSMRLMNQIYTYAKAVVTVKNNGEETKYYTEMNYDCTGDTAGTVKTNIGFITSDKDHDTVTDADKTATITVPAGAECTVQIVSCDDKWVVGDNPTLYSTVYNVYPEEKTIFNETGASVEGWNRLTGASEYSETVTDDTDGSKYIAISSNNANANGDKKNYGFYKGLNEDISTGKYRLSFKTRFGAGVARFALINSVSDASSPFKNKIYVLGINVGSLYADSETNTIPTYTDDEGQGANKIDADLWVNVDCIIDLNSGKLKISVAGSDYAEFNITDWQGNSPTTLPIKYFGIAGSNDGTATQADIKEIKLVQIPQGSVEQKTVTVTADSNMGTVSIDGTEGTSKTVDISSQVTLKATAKDGYKFVSWTDNNDSAAVLSESAEYTIPRLFTDMAVTANFEAVAAGEAIWNFAQYVGTNAVTATAEQTVTYNGLEIHINSGDSVSDSGIYWSAPSGKTSDNTTIVSNNRYIEYTAPADGTLTIAFKGSAVNSSNKPRMYVSCGDSLDCTTKKPDSATDTSTNTNQKELNQKQDASAADTFATMTATLKEGQKYYIWSYLYNKDCTFTISSMSFTPSASE